MKTFNEKQWEIFEQLLINAANFDFLTWEEKKRVLKENLSNSAWSALIEISAWMENE